jgi:hypothetical protein
MLVEDLSGLGGQAGVAVVLAAVAGERELVEHDAGGAEVGAHALAVLGVGLGVVDIEHAGVVAEDGEAGVHLADLVAIDAGAAVAGRAIWRWGRASVFVEAEAAQGREHLVGVVGLEQHGDAALERLGQRLAGSGY